MKKINLFCFVLILTQNLLIANQTVVKDKISFTNLTIYNNNLMMVNENRNFQLNTIGKSTLNFTEVPKNIISESVIVKFNKDIIVLTQNYNFNLINFNNILKENLNKKIKVQTYDDGVLSDKIKSKLISINPTMVQDSSGEIHTINNKDIIFDRIPNKLVSSPELTWDIRSQYIGSVNLNIKYLTRGVSWHSSYVINLDKEKLNLKGWIVSTNNSGITYENARLTFISGNVNKVKNNNIRHEMYFRSNDMKNKSINKSIIKEKISSYYSYQIPNSFTIRDKETKQFSFIEKNDIPFNLYGKINFNDSSVGVSKYSVNQFLEIKNEDNNIVLPTGIVRVYKENYSGKSLFIGEDKINNISKNDNIVLKLGKTYDLKVERNIQVFNRNNGRIVSEEFFSIINQSDSEKTLKLTRKLSPYVEVLNFEYNDNCTVEFCKNIIKNKFLIEYEIKIPAFETKKLMINYKIN